VLTFELPEAITISALYITFQQNRQTVLEKDLTAVTYDTTKVDKVEGKGLSANDYTNEEKAKLGGVEANANNYTLPDASASVKGGVTVGTNVDVSGGKISVKNGTTNQKGVVQLSSATDDTSTTKAATPSAVKAAYDLAAGKQSPATSLAGYGIADAYTKDEVDAKMSSALEYKGSKDTYADLPTTGNKKGDVWNIVNADAAHGVNAGDNVAWNGTTWDVLAGTMDLSAYMLAEDLVATRVRTLELKYDTNVTGNSWSVAFTSLSGVVVTGVWNESQGRIEF
jgi:hypothetical protein